MAKDHKLKVSENSKIVNISTERVYILHNYLKMRKICARSVPRVLTDQQKLERAVVSQYNLDMFNTELKN